MFSLFPSFLEGSTKGNQIPPPSSFSFGPYLSRRKNIASLLLTLGVRSRERHPYCLFFFSFSFLRIVYVRKKRTHLFFFSFPSFFKNSILLGKRPEDKNADAVLSPFPFFPPPCSAVWELQIKGSPHHLLFFFTPPFPIPPIFLLAGI